MHRVPETLDTLMQFGKYIHEVISFTFVYNIINIMLMLGKHQQILIMKMINQLINIFPSFIYCQT